MEFRQNHGNQNDRKIRLQMYSEPPQKQILLKELEALAIERLQVLKCVETAGQDYSKSSSNYRDRLTELLSKAAKGSAPRLAKSFLLNSRNTKNNVEDIQLDIMSHFILQIAYCRTEDLRRWFVQQECNLFLFRFNLEQSSDQEYSTDSFRTIEQFLVRNNCSFEPISKSEQKDLRPQLLDGSASLCNSNSKSTVDSSSFYKVQFTEVLDLVKRRRVFLKDGYAYVPDCDIASLVLSKFRGNISKNLSLISRSLPTLEEDTRVLPLLNALSKCYIGEDFSKNGENEGVITAGQVDHLAKTSFPPCMQYVHQALKRDSHLKHFGRLQYGLFLKGIGLSLEESMKFWRSSFQPKVDSNKFDKQYAYNIRYNYGKEGKRVSMSPYSCMRIITTNMPGPGDAHGCPFRHTETELLRQRLQSVKQLSASSINNIIELSQERQYQLACREYFKEVHSCPDANDIVINHPNEYFLLSQRYLNTDKSSSSSGTNRRVIKVKAENNSMDVSS